MNFNQLTGRDDSHLVPYQKHKLQEEVLSAYLKLKDKLLQFDIELEVVSSYRNYERQLKIWNEKAQGKRKLYDRKGELLDFSDLSKKEILESILCWSAIPGASRHHWGTDLDIFDLRIKEQKQVELSDSEYQQDFSKLTQELSSLISKEDACGFFRPYSQDLGGVARELWHISYKPLSESFQTQYTLEVFEENIKKSDIEFKDLVLENLESVYNQFVNNTTN